MKLSTLLGRDATKLNAGDELVLVGYRQIMTGLGPAYLLATADGKEHITWSKVIGETLARIADAAGTDDWSADPLKVRVVDKGRYMVLEDAEQE